MTPQTEAKPSPPPNWGLIGALLLNFGFWAAVGWALFSAL